MGSQDDILQCQDGIIGGEALGAVLHLQDVQPGSCDPTLLQSHDQGVCIHQPAPRRVDQVGGRFHRLEGSLVEHMVGLGGERHVRAEVVRFPQQPLPCEAPDPQIFHSVGGHVGVEGRDLQAEGLGLGDYLAGDLAEAQEPQLGSTKGVHRVGGRISAPDALSDQPILRCDVPGAGEKQPHGVVRDLVYAVVGNVADHDASLGGGIDVDAFHADACPHDDPALFQ